MAILFSIGDDPVINVMDVMLCRSLEHNKMILWVSFKRTQQSLHAHQVRFNQASPTRVPDLGGLENDLSHLISVTELENPKVCNPGCYRSVCVEIEVAHIALNAVLKFDFINEAEEGW